MSDFELKLGLNNLFEKDETIVIGVSTGIDSMSLLFCMYKLGYKLVVAHINHKRRIESDKEYEFLEKYCEERNIHFEGYEINEEIKGNFQEVARNIRYSFYKKVASKYNSKKIVVCHQLDDQAETILMRLTRGTSYKGYSGIKKITNDDEYQIVRPLLSVSRDEIKKYQLENNIPYFEDSSNSEDHYTRNIVRHHIIPELKEINPKFLKQIEYFSEDMEDYKNMVMSEVISFFNKYVVIEKKLIKFSLNEYEKLNNAVKKGVLIHSVNLLTNNTIEVTHDKLKEMAKFSAISHNSKILEIKEKYVMYLFKNNVCFEEIYEKRRISLELMNEGEYFIENYGKITISQNYHLLPSKKSYMLCYNNTSSLYPIKVRNFNQGDKITINGITKNVGDILRENDVPVTRRKNTLIFSNESGIFFIPGCIRKETDKSCDSKIYITFEEEL